MLKHMRNFLLFVFLSFTFLANAQITVLDTNVIVSITPDIDEYKEEVDMVNTTNSILEFYWDIDRSGVPAEWEFKVCDINLCYIWGVETCPCSMTNFFQPGDTATMMVYIDPNGVEGTGPVNVSILAFCGKDSTYANIPVSYIVDASVSTAFEEKNDDPLLYPNPSPDYFKIKNDESVSSVIVYNIIGKKMFSQKHRAGMSHDVSGLNKGIYLIRLLNKTNNVVKVLRMTKE